MVFKAGIQVQINVFWSLRDDRCMGHPAPGAQEAPYHHPAALWPLSDLRAFFTEKNRFSQKLNWNKSKAKEEFIEQRSLSETYASKMPI